VGAMLSATDPAAVIATFKQMRSPRRLTTLVEAESVFNDGTGIVLFAIAVDFVTRPVGRSRSSSSSSRSWLLGALGAVAGFAASRVLPSVGDHLIEISLSVVLAYGTYLAADALHGSGVIATAVAGSSWGRAAPLRPVGANRGGARYRLGVCGLPGHGLRVPGRRLRNRRRLTRRRCGTDRLGIVAALVGRAVIVYGMLGSWRLARRAWLARSGAASGSATVGRATRSTVKRAAGWRLQGPDGAARDEGAIPFDWLHVVFWSGLRGAVSTALALSLPIDFPNRTALQGITFGSFSSP